MTNSGSGPLQTDVYFNGEHLGVVSSNSADGGWSAFLSLFTGGVANIQSWGTGSAASSNVSNLIQGSTLTKVQGWSAATTPVTQGHLQQATVHAIHPAHATKTVVHAPFKRAWDAGFAGHRKHR
jgi:hypothetical protein